MELIIGTMRRIVVGMVCLGVLGMSGCSKQKPSVPSYADALTIYNQELQRLDRLKQQRDELKATLNAPQTDALEEVATQLLGNSAEIRKQSLDALKDLAGTAAPDVSKAASAQQQALDAAAQQLAAAQKAKAKEKLEQESKRKEAKIRIAELDKEIADQEQKVARAKADLDRADAARK